MKIVTSLSPHRVERQQHCLRSWRNNGLKIVSVQTVGEVDAIRKLFSGVEFVTCEEQPNSWGKPHLPRIAELLKVGSDETILILNSDIEIADSRKKFDGEWNESEPDTLVVGIRRDHLRGSSRGNLNPYGIDAFRITPQLSSLLEKHLEFSIGVPGWDYWIPWRLWSLGKSMRVADSMLMHETHDLGYPREAIKIAYELLMREYRLPNTVLSSFIQWSTGREGMKRKPARRR